MSWKWRFSRRSHYIVDSNSLYVNRHNCISLHMWWERGGRARHGFGIKESLQKCDMVLTHINATLTLNSSPLLKTAKGMTHRVGCKTGAIQTLPGVFFFWRRNSHITLELYDISASYISHFLPALSPPPRLAILKLTHARNEPELT